MFYLKQIILLVGFIHLIYEISHLSIRKTEMEVVYKNKDEDKLPVISICTFYKYLKEYCDHIDNPIELVNETFENTFENNEDKKHFFINRTTRELFEFERNCSFLNEEDLIYIYNNTFHRASKISTYLNFGLFCKLYEFENIDKNYIDGFFKINSTGEKNLTIFIHENNTYPYDVNLKIFFSEFRHNKKAIIIILELNKVIRSRGNLIFKKKQSEFNNTRLCFQNCFKSHNFSGPEFLYLKDEQNYLISDLKKQIGFDLIDKKCKSKCNFNDIFESYFKIEKTTFNGDLIKNKTLTSNSWIIFYQNSRVVSFNFNDVITFEVYLIYLCNVISLIFGLSFFSFFTNLVFYLKKFTKLKIKQTNFRYSMILISILLSFLQSYEIVKEYSKFLTTTDLMMNLVQITPNLTLSVCFNEILTKHAPDYNLSKNEFTSDKKLIMDQNRKHLSNLSIQELVDIVSGIKKINDLFSLEIQISNKVKFVNTVKNSKIFFRNGRFCFRIDLQLNKFITKSKNRIKAIIESESYLFIRNDVKKFEFFFLTSYKTYPSFGNEAYFYENTFRISSETQPSTSDQLYCKDYKKHHDCDTQEICIERCIIVNYFNEYQKLPIDITYVPNDQFCFKKLNLSNSELYFDTDPETSLRMEPIKKNCSIKYNKLDCMKHTFNSINTREKDEHNLKISLFFDLVKITHLNKMELINLINYLIGIFSLWLGFSFRIISKYIRKLLSKLMKLKQADRFLSMVLLIGLIVHSYYINIYVINTSQVAITYFQPSKFILQPVFTLCFELDKIYGDDFQKDSNEISGNYLKRHTKNLSQLVNRIRFLNEEFDYKELNYSDFDNFETKDNYFRHENLEITFFFYYLYKCYEFKHSFEPKELDFNFGLETIFLQFDLIDKEVELMFYPDKCFSLENKIFIPAHSYTILRYIAIYTIPVNENITFCLRNRDDRTNTLINQVREELANNEFSIISTTFLPLTHEYFKYPIRDEIFLNALNLIEDRIKNKTIESKKNCSIKYRNIALTEKSKIEDNFYRIQINPSFIDVIVEQKIKYTICELILIFGSVPLFWLDFSLKDLLELLVFCKKKLKKKKKNAVFNQKNLETIPKSSNFIVFNVGLNQDRIVFI